MHEVLVNRLGGLSLPRKSVVRLTDRPNMTLDVYRGRKTTIQQYNLLSKWRRAIEHKHALQGIYHVVFVMRFGLTHISLICINETYIVCLSVFWGWSIAVLKIKIQGRC